MLVNCAELNLNKELLLVIMYIVQLEKNLITSD